MNRQNENVFNGWQVMALPFYQEPPQLVAVRAQHIPERHFFARHRHAWNQLIYAVSGVLTVSVDRNCFIVPSNHAVWMPTCMSHEVGSRQGAEFRSLYEAAKPDPGLPSVCAAYEVSPLLKALIIEAASLNAGDEPTYAGRVKRLMIDQLPRLLKARFSLPWPTAGSKLQRLCEALYDDPSDMRSSQQWSEVLNMSSRSMSRQFEAELGVNLRSWRSRLRLLRSVELLQNGASITTTALSLGYSSTSAFSYMFHAEMGCCPTHYRRQHG
jgi:AraC-like DNA-binding protein